MIIKITFISSNPNGSHHVKSLKCLLTSSLRSRRSECRFFCSCLNLGESRGPSLTFITTCSLNAQRCLSAGRVSCIDILKQLKRWCMYEMRKLVFCEEINIARPKEVRVTSRVRGCCASNSKGVLSVKSCLDV